MKGPPDLTDPERLVWAAAFAKAYAESADTAWISVPRAIKAAYFAVDALRAALDLCPMANKKYATESAAYQKSVENNMQRPPGVPPSFAPITTMETEDAHFAMYEAFIGRTPK